MVAYSSQLVRVLERGSATTPTTAAGGQYPGVKPALAGDTLVVAMHPSGSVFPGTAVCTVCTALARAGFESPKRRGGGGGGGDAASPSRPTGPMAAFSEPWCCPRCCVVQVREPALRAFRNQSVGPGCAPLRVVALVCPPSPPPPPPLSVGVFLLCLLTVPHAVDSLCCTCDGAVLTTRACCVIALVLSYYRPTTTTATTITTPTSTTTATTPQNATVDLLLGGDSSLAVVKPLKPATFDVLAHLWSHLRLGGDDDPVFLGLTPATLLARLEELRNAGQRGTFLVRGCALARAGTLMRNATCMACTRAGMRPVFCAALPRAGLGPGSV